MGNNYFVVHMKSDSNTGRVITFDKRCNSYKFDPRTGLFEFYYRPGEDSRLLLGSIPSQNVLWIENVIFDERKPCGKCVDCKWYTSGGCLNHNVGVPNPIVDIPNKCKGFVRKDK